MRQLRCLLKYASRSLQLGAVTGAALEPQLWCGGRAAGTAGQRAWGNARDSSLSPPLGIAGYATEPPPSASATADAPPAAACAAAQDVGDSITASGEEQPAAAAAGVDADVEADLQALGFEDDDGSELPAGITPLDLEALGSSSSSSSDDENLETSLLSASESDEDENADELYILRKAARAAAKKKPAAAAAQEADADAAGSGREAGEGVLATAGRQLSMLEEIQQASKKRQKFLLQQQLTGRGDTERLAEELKPPETGDFSMKIVDVNRTSKGARAGRVQGFSALVVVGNQNGILGQGSGKALEAKAAVDKATRKALKHLTYVPRFREHTIHYPVTVLYGKTKVIMYPKASGRGIMASNLMTSLCQLAGIKDIGIKIQGSRNLRNSVQALFKAFDQMSTRVDEDSVDAGPIWGLPLGNLEPPVLDTTGWDEMEEKPPARIVYAGEAAV